MQQLYFGLGFDVHAQGVEKRLHTLAGNARWAAVYMYLGECSWQQIT